VKVHGRDDVDGDAAQNPDGKLTVTLDAKKLCRLLKTRRFVDGETGRSKPEFFYIVSKFFGAKCFFEAET
jgi:hypothetical protein